MTNANREAQMTDDEDDDAVAPRRPRMSVPRHRQPQPPIGLTEWRRLLARFYAVPPPRDDE
jgi:hypothetical protein